MKKFTCDHEDNIDEKVECLNRKTHTNNQSSFLTNNVKPSFDKHNLGPGAKCAEIIKSSVSYTGIANDKVSDPIDDRIYRGLTGYIDYRDGFRSESSLTREKKFGARGPLKASLHIRESTRFDFQYDICKDYRETGYCGYGDTCKFLHDRSDFRVCEQAEQGDQKKQQINYKHIRQQRERLKGETNMVPGIVSRFCLLCKDTWDQHSKPVKTICGHYFHEECALKYSRTGRCPFCAKPTKGIFNMAIEITTRLKKQR